MNNPTSTFLDHARAEADQPRGRFSQQAASRVVAVPRYPQMPSNSHWSGDQIMPTEPPLNMDVNELPDLGGFVEHGNLEAETPIASSSPLTIVERSASNFSKLHRRRV